MDDIFGGDERHELHYLPTDLIIPNDWNAYEQNEVTFDALVDEVAETGIIAALTVVPLSDGRFRIIGGEHRWMAAKAAGEDEVPCLVLMGEKWQDEGLQKFVTVKLNMLKGKLNPEKFIKLYNEAAEKYTAQELQKAYGFTDKGALNKIIKSATKAAKQALPKEMHAELEERARDAKTVDDIGKIVQEMFAKNGNTVDKSFMVFTYGKQEHVYISMSPTTRKILDKALTFCEVSGTDINDVIAPILKEGIAARVAELKVVQESDEDDELPEVY